MEGLSTNPNPDLEELAAGDWWSLIQEELLVELKKQRATHKKEKLIEVNLNRRLFMPLTPNLFGGI